MFFDWWLKRHMKDPVRGVFRMTSWDARRAKAARRFRSYTGMITAPGIPATEVKHKDDLRGRLAGALIGEIAYPVLADRADPSRFVILWKEVPRQSSERARKLSKVRAQAVRLHNENPARQLLNDGFYAVAAPGMVIRPDKLAQLRGVWEQASAVVTAVHEIPPPPGVPLGMLDITLEVTRANGSSYSPVMRVFFSAPTERDRFSTVGTRFSVRIEPDNPDLLAIEMASLADAT